MHRVEFVREKRVAHCNTGAAVRHVAIENGVEIYSGIDRKLNCRGFGLCGSCKVVVSDDSKLGTLTVPELIRRGLGLLKKNERLACQAKVFGKSSIETKTKL